MRHATLCGLAAALLLATSAFAQKTIHVDAQNGKDTNTGTAANPVRSITRGLALATANTEVIVRGGIYGPNATGETLPIAFGGPVHDGVVLRGLTGAVVDLAGSTSVFLRIGTQAKGARITGLRFVNSDQKGWWTRVIDTTANGSAVEIDRNVFDGCNRGIVIWGANNTIVGMNVHHNVFMNMSNDAINEFGTTTSNRIESNTIVGSASGPNFVGILTESANTTFRNNLIVGMRDGFLTGKQTVGTNFVGNNTWKNTNDWAGQITSPPAGNTALDPQFVDQSKADLRLKAASKLIDAGSPAAFARADVAGIPSAVDGDGNGSILPDVGAHEYSTVAHVASSTSNSLTLDATGPTATVGFIILAGDEGRLVLPGFSPILIDLTQLFPISFSGAFPIKRTFPVPPLPPGVRLATQAMALDARNGILVPGHLQLTEF